MIKMNKITKLNILSAALVLTGVLINNVGSYVNRKLEDEKRKEDIYNAVAEYMAKKGS